MGEVLQAYDWISLAAQVAEQLAAVQAKLAEAPEQEREQGWLREAQALLASDADARSALMARARRLPELAAVRHEHAADLIGPWSDALEHLHAGIVFNAGLRSPLIEALFPHRKFDVLRRGNVDHALTYGTEFHRRLTSTYVDRLLAREEFAFAKPSVDEVNARYASLAPDGDAALGEEEAAALIGELEAKARGVEVALKQAKLLAEAALVRTPGAFQELSLKSKPKTRSAPKPKKEAAEAVEAAEVVEASPEKEKEKEKGKKAKPAKAPKAKPATEAKPAKAAAKKRKPQPEASA